jgi:hypothetical protein
MESVTKRPNHDLCITCDEGKKNSVAPIPANGVWGAPSTRMDANEFVSSSPIATKRKPRANTKNQSAMLNRLLVSNPSLRMRLTKRFAITRL